MRRPLTEKLPRPTHRAGQSYAVVRRGSMSILMMRERAANVSSCSTRARKSLLQGAEYSASKGHALQLKPTESGGNHFEYTHALASARLRWLPSLTITRFVLPKLPVMISGGTGSLRSGLRSLA